MYISSHATNEREEESFCVVVSHVFSFYFITSEKKNKRFRPRPFRLKKDKIFSFSSSVFVLLFITSHQFIEENERDDDDDDVFARCCRCVPPTNAHQEFCPDEGSACCSRCSQKKSAVERNWSRRAI
jgi:hypothetical protein